jgi:hypothetical protein
MPASSEATILDARPLAPTPTSIGRYLVAHWRGEHSLARSFWAHFVLVNVVLTIADRMVDASGLVAADVTQAFFAMVGALGAGLVVVAWQLVGLARAAHRHARRGGKARWAWLAQVVVVLACARALVEGSVIGRQVVEIGIALAGMDEMSRYEVAMVADDQLAIAGFFAFSIDQAVRTTLARHPRAWLVQLDSPGGRIGPARDVRDMIERSTLDTYTSRECASACTIAFLAGRQRILAHDARLGFHQSFLPGVARERLAAYEAEDRAHMARRGVKTWFIDRAFATPNADMWFPSLMDLMLAGVVTHIHDGAAVVSIEADCREHRCR